MASFLKFTVTGTVTKKGTNYRGLLTALKLHQITRTNIIHTVDSLAAAPAVHRWIKCPKSWCKSGAAPTVSHMTKVGEGSSPYQAPVSTSMAEEDIFPTKLAANRHKPGILKGIKLPIALPCVTPGKSLMNT